MAIDITAGGAQDEDLQHVFARGSPGKRARAVLAGCRWAHALEVTGLSRSMVLALLLSIGANTQVGTRHRPALWHRTALQRIAGSL